jgi:hypothetical protein
MLITLSSSVWTHSPSANFFLADKWDGCTYTPQIQGLFGPNVDGLGYVDQVLS